MAQAHSLVVYWFLHISETFLSSCDHSYLASCCSTIPGSRINVTAKLRNKRVTPGKSVANTTKEDEATAKAQALREHRSREEYLRWRDMASGKKGMVGSPTMFQDHSAQMGSSVTILRPDPVRVVHGTSPTHGKEPQRQD